MGFGERGWLDLLNARVDSTQINYEPYMEVLPRLSKKLRDEGCDYIIALNHMHYIEDVLMAKAFKANESLDLILGGHDHLFLGQLVKETGVYVQKSGTDFETFSNLTLLFDVSPDEFEDFKIRVSGDRNICMIGNRTCDRSTTVQLYYDEDLQRAFISEKVKINRMNYEQDQ